MRENIQLELRQKWSETGSYRTYKGMWPNEHEPQGQESHSLSDRVAQAGSGLDLGSTTLL